MPEKKSLLSAFFDHAEPSLRRRRAKRGGRRNRRSQDSGRRPWVASRRRHMTIEPSIPSVPCFRMIARPAAVKLAVKNPLFFIVLLKVQPLACRRDEAN